MKKLCQAVFSTASAFSKVAFSAFPSVSRSYSTYCDCGCECERCLCGPPKTQIGKLAPDFKKEALMDGEFQEIQLGDYKGKWLCLFFYPLDFTFVCPTEILAFSDRVSEFEELDCAVVGASVDSNFSHFAWTEVPRNKGGIGEIDIPLISDITHTLSRDYGVLMDGGIATRGLFLIDPAQNLRQIIVNDIPIGRNVDEVLRLLEALQHYEEFGEVCPIGWQKGDKTIKASIEGYKEFSEEEF